jgi:predicted SAM-dependent methyltransferase
MSNLQPQTTKPNLASPEAKKATLEKFHQIANEVSPPSNLIVELAGSILRWSSQAFTRLLQDTGYNKRKIANYNQPIKLNIGSGEHNQEGFLTTDILPAGGFFLKLLIGKHKVTNDLFLDVTYPDKYLFNCADAVVLSHVLEHIPPKFSLQSLRNCWHYLKSGAPLRVTVPYLGIYEYPEWLGKKKLRNPMLGKNLMVYGAGHKFMYDSELLILLLEEAGFQDIQEVQYQEGLLGYMDTPGRQYESIYVIGVKP